MKAFAVVFIFLSTAFAHAQYKAENLSLGSPDRIAQNDLRYQNLQLFPIIANKSFLDQHKNLRNYVTLKEALAQKKIAITEKGDGGTVNTLFVENVSKDTIIVLSGEVVQGGQQDRVIAQDFVLYPKSGKKDVSVYCVEHGRWNGSAGFKEYFSISSKEVRKAATVTKDQRVVWNTVEETTTKNGARSSTGTLAELKRSETFGKDLKKYTDHFETRLADKIDVIGVIAVTGNSIMGCDMFANHEIFVKYLPGLLNSYATEAITNGKPVTVSYDKVDKYLTGLITDEAKQEEEVVKKGVMLKEGKKKIHVSSFE